MVALLHRSEDFCILDLIVVLVVTIAIIGLRYRSAISK